MSARPRRLRYFSGLALALLAIVATRYREVDLPLFHYLRGPGHVDPLTLHLSGEFVEGNLGLTKAADGSLTLRMIAQQYLFIPHCVVIPAGVPVRLRITSADAVHVLSIEGTDYAVKAVPGTVSQASLELDHPGEYAMPCREFCGAGHYQMRARMIVVPREQLLAAELGKGGFCAAR
jgi:cytochrome c oxidase subunit 2